jgi:hypothetical protein
MLADLDDMHETLIRAYKAALLLSGIDLDSEAATGADFPTSHLPI